MRCHTNRNIRETSAKIRISEAGQANTMLATVGVGVLLLLCFSLQLLLTVHEAGAPLVA